jgi:hypothetical protein
MAQFTPLSSSQELRRKGAESRRECADMVRRCRFELRETRAATEAAITGSRDLMAQADAIIARSRSRPSDIVAVPKILRGQPVMSRYEVVLESLALYQQARRIKERVKTLRREIDDVSREIYQRLDDLDIIMEESSLFYGPTSRPRKIDVARQPLAAKQMRFGTVEAEDESAAMETAAAEFKVAP